MSMANWLEGLGSTVTGNIIVPFLFVLTLVVFCHELGHFLVARWCGVFVRTFSIGFGPEVVGFTDRKGTRWRLALIPLGGYVKFLGDDSEASNSDRAALAAMGPAERARTFAGKSVAARAAIVVAGPVANFILAIVLFSGLALAFGEDQVIPRIDGVKAGSAAEMAGFRPGDVVESIDGKAVDSYGDVLTLVATNSGRPLSFVVDRGGENVSLTATPENRAVKDALSGTQDLGVLDISGPELPARVAKLDATGVAASAGFEVGDVVIAIDGAPISSFKELQSVVVAAPDKSLSFTVRRGSSEIVIRATPTGTDDAGKTIGRLGLIAAYDPADVRHVSYNVVSAIESGVERSWFIADRTVAYVAGVFSGRESASQIGGVTRMAQVAQQAASISFETLVAVAGVMSVSIGLLNLLPIPLLDGGHLLFYLAEAVRGRPLSERVQDAGMRFGLLLIVGLMIFANGNDYRLWRHIGALFGGS